MKTSRTPRLPAAVRERTVRKIPISSIVTVLPSSRPLPRTTGAAPPPEMKIMALIWENGGVVTTAWLKPPAQLLHLPGSQLAGGAKGGK